MSHDAQEADPDERTLRVVVRKVLVVLNVKRIPYEIDPIVPFLGDVFIRRAE